MHSQQLHPFQRPFSVRVILTGGLSKLTLEIANFTGVAEAEFAMLSVAVKPEHMRMHLKPEPSPQKQLNNGTNLLDVSRTLLRIVARLPKTEYSQDKSNGHIRRQAAERELDDLPDPASESSTSQG
jgi:hypothetical protein